MNDGVGGDDAFVALTVLDMGLIVGNVIVDASAQSFVSLADADAYLAPEGRAAWTAATDAEKEAALVRASRWLAASFAWLDPDMGDAALADLGRATARLAVDALTVDLHASEDVAGATKREKVGSIEVEYRDGAGAQAAGRRWPWLLPMLRPYVVSGAMRRVVRA